MKKVLAILLAIALLVVPFGTISYAEASEYLDTTITLRPWDTVLSGDKWAIYFDASDYTSPDWSYKYQGINYEIDGIKGTTAVISSAGGSAIYCDIPTSVLPATDGTIITFKAGQYAATEGTTVGLNITNDLTFVTSEGRLTQTNYINADKVEIAPQSTATEIYFSLKEIIDNVEANDANIITGYESWDNFLSPAACDGNRVASLDGTVGEEWPELSSGVFVNGKPVNYWQGRFKNIPNDFAKFYIGGFEAVEGTTVTLKGNFAVSNGNWEVIDTMFFPEINFVYDGANWTCTRPTSYKNAFLTGVASDITSTTGDNMVLYLDTSNYPSTHWRYKYEGFTIECNGVVGTTGQVSSADSNRLYCTIPTSVVPNVDGTVFTIKAGKYASDVDGVNKGINIVEDFDVIVFDGHLVAAHSINSTNIEIFNDASSSFYFRIKDDNGNLISTGVESWDYFLQPANYDGRRIDSADWATIYSGVFADDTPINYWGGTFKNYAPGEFYVSGFNAVAGTTVKIRGYFASCFKDGWDDINAYLYINEIEFKYDGSVWSVVEDIEYTEYQGTPEFVEFAGNTGMYFTAGETEFPYSTDPWTVKAVPADDESGIFINGDRTEVFIKKIDVDKWYVCFGDAGITLKHDDEIIITGSFVYDTHRITFAETEFLYEEVITETYTGTPVLKDAGDKYGSARGFYFFSNDGAPEGGWDLGATAVDGDDNGVFVNDVKTGATLKKISGDSWYVDISSVTLNYGDVVKIKGSFQLADAIVTFNEAVFQYDGKHFAQGTFTATDFTVTGLAYKSISYSTEKSVWHMYFKLSNNILGTNDQTYFPYFTYEIDGKEYTAHAYKSNEWYTLGEENIYHLYIPIAQLPQTLDREYVITLKAATIQGRDSESIAHDYGIRLTEDYQFTVGANYTAATPSVDYVITSTGGNQGGIYLTSNDDFPTVGWDCATTKVGENDGIFLNGEPTNVPIKKYADNKYYVCISDVEGLTAKEGDIVMIKGTFTTKNLNFVTFKTQKYVYTDGKWSVYSPVEDVTSTGVTGDANGDSKFNVLDFVSVAKYIEKESNKINVSDADLNGDGIINLADMVILKKLMLGVMNYQYGANLTGVPTYSNDGEMRLAAYVSPTLEDGFDDYKAAGFTTLISENRGVYGAENFADYMNLAAEKGLDVLVHSGNLEGMLKGSTAVDANWLQAMYNDLSQYSSFRGLFMADEPTIAMSNNYKNVVDVLRTLDPHMDLFTSCLPTYTPDESYLSSDSSLSLAEKYSGYANTYGNILGEFTYDFYPFKHSYKYVFFQGYKHNDYMRSDWFQNLTLVASNAKGKYNTGITVQSYAEEINAKDHYRTVSRADVSFQVYTALAYGMKSINYFTYGEHWDESVGTTSSMIYNGQKTDVYYAVQGVNNEIKNFDNVLLNFNWQGTIGISKTNSDGMMDYVDNYTSKRISASSATNDAIIGCLKDTKGYDGFMLVNATDPSDNVTETISVTFNGADHAKVFVNGEESIVELDNGTYSAELAPGQGIFVIPYIA